ncbi:restriction endonuclease [Streptomyces nitrosporeus]|uniref:restriction endonuclease n=1 Tax=Streptomyces nitrosporeus TaxID=28894 RepID=UPI0019A6D4F7|nr:restriction endonuclease [Streptomyces nitrosporeus]GGZ18245.1 restriction endonuclease [Streptomyces nitrosporeus]
MPRARRPRGRHRQRNQNQILGLALGGTAVFLVLSALFSWLAQNLWVLAALGTGAAGAATWWVHRCQQALLWDRIRQQGLRYGLPQLDALHHRDFEYAVRDLMRRNGCHDARQTDGAGGNGADVLATDPMGRTWVIQCKHRKNGDQGSAVGTPDLQRVNGCARQLYGADIVLAVTNGRFTARCAPLAAQLHMHLVDRRALAVWAGSNRPLWELLNLTSPGAVTEQALVIKWGRRLVTGQSPEHGRS